MVDCGTAVTIDALAADGQHLGGVIVPRMRLMREALYRKPGRFPGNEQRICSVRAPATAFGADAVCGGISHRRDYRSDDRPPRSGARLLTGGAAGDGIALFTGQLSTGTGFDFHRTG
ncbi:MAG: type III pantothenate kinase [Candidatus Competibacteraceae bacterium]